MASTAVLQMYDKNDKALLSGQSSVKSHNDWLELSSFSYGVSRLRGTAAVRSMTITFKPVNDAAEVISSTVARGTRVAKTVLKAFKQAGDSQEWYLQMEMKDVLVESFSASGGDDTPVTATLNFASIAVVYQSSEKTNVELDGAGPDDWSYAGEESPGEFAEESSEE